MSAITEEVKLLLDRLPPETTIEDLQYHLYVIDKVQSGLESIEKDGGFTQEQVEERMSKWLTS
jgi:hypothetical protein